MYFATYAFYKNIANVRAAFPHGRANMENGWTYSVYDALRHFGVSKATGLSTEKAKIELEKYGPNGMCSFCVSKPLTRQNLKMKT